MAENGVITNGADGHESLDPTALRYRAPRPTVVKPSVLGAAGVAVVGAPTVLVQR